MLRLIVEAALVLLTAAGLVYSAIALLAARDFLRERSSPAAAPFTPPVSILKPLKGSDSSTYSALKSHCALDYPEYEIIFGVNDSSDPAAAVVRRLMAEFPQLPIQLVVCTEVFGSNRKVSNLIHLLAGARHQFALVNDGDITVAPEYLRDVMSHFSADDVGLVTCLYRGKPSRTTGSRLEALGIATEFVPGVLTAQWLEGGLRFALGSTLALRRSALDAIAGFRSVVNYLADDYQLGERIAAKGFKLVLSQTVVETSVPAYRFTQFWEHQMRWSRTMRISRPAGYAGMLFTFVMAWAILLIVVAPRAWWSWTLLIAALLARFSVAGVIGRRVLQDSELGKNLWLLPLRDLLAPAIWIWSFAGNEVTWRGERFRVSAGEMLPLVSQVSSAPVSRANADSEVQRR